MFKKETDLSVFVNLKVTSGRGEEGVIESSFGQSGKFKVKEGWFRLGFKDPHTSNSSISG